MPIFTISYKTSFWCPWDFLEFVTTNAEKYGFFKLEHDTRFYTVDDLRRLSRRILTQSITFYAVKPTN